MTGGVQAFIFVGKTYVTRFAEAFLKARRRGERLLADQQQPLITKVYRDGRVLVTLSHEEWKTEQT